jgi:hypothetical protein
MTQYALSKKTVLGVATEAVPGTAETAVTHYVPTKHTYKRMLKQQYISDDRGVLDDNNDVVALVVEGNHALKGDFYADTSSYFIYAALGADAVTQPDVSNAPTAYQHIITPTNNPTNGVLPTLTLFKSYQTDLYQMPFSVVEKFSFKLANQGVLTFDADCVSNQHATFAGTWSPSISTVHPMAGSVAVIKWGGLASLDIDNIEVDFEQKFTFWYSGKQDYIAAYPAGRTCKVKFDARFDTDTIYNDFVSGTQEALEFIVTGINLGGAVVQKLDLLLPTVNLDSGEHDTTKGNVQVKMAGTAMPTTGTLIQATVVNTVTAYTL